MTETTIIALVASALAALPPSLVAWAALRATKENGVKADSLVEKTTEIHTLTNGSLSKVQASLETANEKISGLEKLVASVTAASLAANHLASLASKPSRPRRKSRNRD